MTFTVDLRAVRKLFIIMIMAVDPQSRYSNESEISETLWSPMVYTETFQRFKGYITNLITLIAMSDHCLTLGHDVFFLGCWYQ